MKTFGFYSSEDGMSWNIGLNDYQLFIPCPEDYDRADAWAVAVDAGLVNDDELGFYTIADVTEELNSIKKKIQNVPGLTAKADQKPTVKFDTDEFGTMAGTVQKETKLYYDVFVQGMPTNIRVKKSECEVIA